MYLGSQHDEQERGEKYEEESYLNIWRFNHTFAQSNSSSATNVHISLVIQTLNLMAIWHNADQIHNTGLKQISTVPNNI